MKFSLTVSGNKVKK